MARTEVVIDLQPLVQWLAGEAPGLEQRHVDRDLLRAQIADRYRRLGIEPVDPGSFDELTQDLVPEAWRRLALVTSTLELEEVKNVLPLLFGGDARRQLADGFVELARSLDLLTMEVLAKSPPRIEELARTWVSTLGARVSGESPDESNERLEKLDYRRLLAETERAKESAQKSSRPGIKTIIRGILKQ